MSHLFYNFFVTIYAGIIKIASLSSTKAKLWVKGRENIFTIIETRLHPFKNKKKIWVHCASLGEFEQGRPLIEAIKHNYADVAIVLTFFSPSGYEIRKNYAAADAVFYLPVDTTENAIKLVRIIQPSAAFFIKYEFWFNYLRELKRQDIPTYLVSGIFRQDQYFFKGYAKWFREQLSCFTHFYLQNEVSQKLLNEIGYTNTTITGDTRFDRVAAIANNAEKIPLMEQFKHNRKILIAGSTWQQDETLLSTLRFNPNEIGLIIAPHEINETNIQAIENTFSNYNCIRFSNANETNISKAEVLIIDNIGMLSSLYQYGFIAYIGGGFGKGIHNILEAATFGLPIIVGPKHQKFTEATELIKAGGAFVIQNTENLHQLFHLLCQDTQRNKAAAIAKKYVLKNMGATEKILSSFTLK